MTGDTIKFEDMLFNDLTDIQMASKVRMLLRTDLDHEATCCAARDRIMYLSQQLEEMSRKSSELFFKFEKQWRELDDAKCKLEHLRYLEEQDDREQKLRVENEEYRAEWCKQQNEIEQLKSRLSYYEKSTKVECIIKCIPMGTMRAMQPLLPLPLGSFIGGEAVQVIVLKKEEQDEMPKL